MKSVTSRVGSAVAVAIVSVALVSCSALPSSKDGSSPSSPAGVMLVEIAIGSDVGTASQVQVDIDAREDSQRIDEQNVSLPFADQIEVSTRVPFPLKGVTVKATGASGAGWIECQVSLDGEVISEGRAEGSGATAMCTKELDLGPQ